MFVSKANYLARRPATLRFRILSWDEQIGAPCRCHEENCLHEGRVIWEPDLVDTRTAEDIWTLIAERNRPRRDVAVQDGEAFLTELAHGGEIDLTPTEIFKLASEKGISQAAVLRAKAKLGMVSVKDGFPAVVVGWKVGGK